MVIKSDKVPAKVDTGQTEVPAVLVQSLSKTFYTGFFGPIPGLRAMPLGPLHRVVNAVEDVSFSIAPGQIFALLGANGAGKSTTMKMLMGLIRPTGGTASIFGVKISLSEARRKVGYLPENPSFYDELTPTEIMRLFCAMNGVPRRDVKAHSSELLERVGIGYAADRPLRKLSKGMHQRVGIAQALIGKPQLLVLDEPFSGLDPVGRREIREVLFEERSRGATLLFSSHILPDVEALCDRFLLLDQGRVSHQGKLDDLAKAQGDIELSLSQCSDQLHQALVELGAIQSTVEARRQSGRIVFHLPHSKTQQALSLISQYRGELVILQPRRSSLEDLFSSQTVEGETK